MREIWANNKSRIGKPSMERTTDISDLVEKCKDKSFVSENRGWIRERMCKPPLRDQVRALLATRKNVFGIRLIEAMDVPADELVPSLNDRKNINQYVYSTYYHLYMAGLIGKDKFERARKSFQCMKNHEKMFVDTENSFIISRMEGDRRKDKVVKREFNRVEDAKGELKSLLIELPEITRDEVHRIEDGVSRVRSVFVVDLDPVFNIGILRCQAKEEASQRISEIRDVLFSTGSTHPPISTLGDIDEETGGGSDLKRDMYHKFERVFSGPEKFKFICTPLFYGVDRLLKNRITRLYDSVVKLHRMKEAVYFVSTHSLSQVLAELLFFEYSALDIRTVISAAGTSPEIHREIQRKEGARVVSVCSAPPPSLEGEDIYWMGYESFQRMIDGMFESWSNSVGGADGPKDASA